MNRDCTTEQTIDLALWAERIWAGRVVVLKITAIAIAVGVIVAFVTPKKYTARSIKWLPKIYIIPPLKVESHFLYSTP